uniref:PH domain-containing protein n=1 Tax=Photinus pyralis TaxID=7054 RepID=A0A1Y1LP69_PHOPY
MEGETSKPRRLSQIFDPISRLNELTRESRSTPSSPRLLPRRATNSSSVLPPPPPLATFDTLDAGAGPCDGNTINWQERCLELQLELHRSRAQATRTRDMLRDKLSELEQRVLEAEGRAEEAEDKVRIMEQKLAWSQSNDSNTQISRLEGEIEEQRQLRLHDARQVEAKAARIKEWVTNKLRELEQQNQVLREQNIKCNQQLELLKNHIALSDRRRSESCSPEPRGQVAVGQSASRTSRHRRHQSVCISTNSFEPSVPSASFINSNFVTSNSSMDPLSEDLRVAVDNLSLGRITSGSASDPDLAHDYAEIYTPSREKVPWPRAPTPPLHRFPSWENRIYQVAADGLTLTGTTPSDVGPEQAGYQDIPVPVYATVKGRASQIRSMPFTGDSSDDSSDGEGNNTAAIDGTNTHSRSSGDTTGSSPGKRTASSSSGSPSKSKTRGVSDTSFESGMSDDYAVPPDALSCDTTSLESSILRTSFMDSPNKKSESIEKSGSLAKLGGKLKTWRKRWFVLKNGVLTYYKNQSDINRKPQGQILLDEICKITRADGSNTFEIDTGKKTYYLTADSITAMEDWVRTLQNVQRRNATKLLLSKEENKPSVQGWLTKVKNGHAKKCWCVLIGKMFLYFKSPTDTTPAGQINMRDSRVEEVDHLSDSDSEDKDAECTELTLGIFPNHQGPTYLLCPGKQEKDSWLYHLTVASGGGPSSGTQYEQLIHKLMEVDGDTNCVLWRHPVLLHVPCTKDGAIPSYFPLTTLPTEALQAEAIKQFKCLQLFMSAAVDQAGIDYHVILAQNALQQCLDMPELQAELICALIKQTSKSSPLPKLGVQVSTQKLLKKSASQEDKYKEHKEYYKDHKDHKGPPSYTLIQGWQLLALSVSLFVPKSSRLLWFLKHHLQRNADNRTECGKYASYCERALERTILTGGREYKPSRMEVLSILLKNPQHHALPHSMPVHLLNGTYHISSFDGSSTVKEFQDSLATEIGCRATNGFALFSDDPIEKDLEHTLDPSAKLCDVISKWEVALREKGLGKFENTRVIRVTYKNRLWWKNSSRLETDKERLLLCYQINKQIVAGRFPLSKELALELAALMVQLDTGDCSFGSHKNTSINNTLNLHTAQSAHAQPTSTHLQSLSAHQSPNSTLNGSSLHGTLSPSNLLQNSSTLTALNSVHHILTAHSNQALSAIDKFYPYRYRDQLSQEALADLQAKLLEKWRALKGRTQLDCVRIYLTCTRKWPFFGATLFQARLRQHDSPMIWLAVNEDSITVLDLATMQQCVRYPYTNVLTFGGCQEDFMLVVTQNDQQPSQKLIFSLSKPKILELTLLIADYMNLLIQNPGTPLLGTLSRGTMVSVNQSVVNQSIINQAIVSQSQPDILKSTPDHGLQRSDSKRRTHIDSGLA